jgi:hypothetical protein
MSPTDPKVIDIDAGYCRPAVPGLSSFHESLRGGGYEGRVETRLSSLDSAWRERHVVQGLCEVWGSSSKELWKTVRNVLDAIVTTYHYSFVITASFCEGKRRTIVNRGRG